MMGVLQTALDRLGAITVAGVRSYTLEETPEMPGTAQLPGLLILPELGGESPGLAPSAFSAGDGVLTIQVAHALLVRPAGSGGGRLRDALPQVTALVDAYLAALAADPLLDGALPLALRCGVRIGVVRVGSLDYHGAVFTHRWTLHLHA